MNKKLMIFGVIGFFALALVSAALVINTFTFNVGVDEPFTVQYAVLGDAGDYSEEVYGTCSTPLLGITWFSSGDSSVPTGNMYPGESRKLCVKMDNAGQSPIDYTITSEIQIGHGNYADCAIAFPQTTLSGTVPGESTLIDGQEFTVPGDAPAVDGCEVVVSVARG